MSMLEVKDLQVYYGVIQALKGISFEVEQGDVVALIGANGAGKTTLMKILLGLQRPDEGIVELFGKEPSEDRGYLLKIGSMIEETSFYEHLNAIEILEMHLRYMGKEASVSGMLDRVGLYHARKKPVSSYSLGMKQRLGFARALIHRPELLVLDEPLNGMDPVVAAEMIQMLKEAAQNGAAILLSSHMLGEMRKTADRIGGSDRLDVSDVKLRRKKRSGIIRRRWKKSW